MIRRLFSKWFGVPNAAVVQPAQVWTPAAPASPGLPDSYGDDVPLGAVPADDVEDRFYRLVLGVDTSAEPALSAAEQTAIRRLRDTFGNERFDVRLLPRLPAVVPQLMRSLRSDDTDTRSLAEQITRDSVLVGEVIRVANSAFYRPVRPMPVTSLTQAITLIGQDGLRRVVMQLVMRPILRTDSSSTYAHAGDRLWEHAERCARACAFLGEPGCDPFEAFLAGLVSHTGAQVILAELEKTVEGDATYSRPFVAALAQQMERLSLHAARQWDFPSRVVQALAERADPTDAGARTPLGRALLAASRVAMLDVMIEHGAAHAGAVLLAVPGENFSQGRLTACQAALRPEHAVEA